MPSRAADTVQVDVGPAADLPPGFFESVRAGTPPRASSSDSGGVLGEWAPMIEIQNTHHKISMRWASGRLSVCTLAAYLALSDLSIKC